MIPCLKGEIKQDLKKVYPRFIKLMLAKQRQKRLWKNMVTDVFSTYRNGRQIGESAMIVIDSDTGKYEKIEIPEKLK